jgi:hypothetical protein
VLWRHVGYTPDDFFRQADNARTIPELKSQSETADMWRAVCAQKSEQMRKKAPMRHSSDPMTAKRARSTVRQLERERNRALQGVNKADSAAASLQTLADRFWWVTPYVRSLDGEPI